VHAQDTKTIPWWKMQSIDTMKYSRDLSREKLKDPSFNVVIDKQVSDIAKTNATHIGIGTPYDEEFIAILTRWVQSARKNNLKIWFRGNFSGWEKWFEYPSITPEMHTAQVSAFIEKHADIFEDGDIFSTCPECENGGPGDPRQTGNVKEFRTFIINEYTACTKAFADIHKKVACNYFSMNADVARTVMDKETTNAIGGIVTIDHYVKTPSQLADDIRQIARETGGKIVLGEFGVPIPDIHGDMNEQEQAEWLKTALPMIAAIPEVVGVNYWLNVGGSTALWNDDGQERPAVRELTSAFSPRNVTGSIVNIYGQPLSNVAISNSLRTVVSEPNGTYKFPFIQNDLQITFKKNGYKTLEKSINEVLLINPIILVHTRQSFIENIIVIIKAFFHL
jgi:hypothetical protein